MKKSKVLITILVIILVCCLSLALIACYPTDDNEDGNDDNSGNNGSTEFLRFELTDNEDGYIIYLGYGVKKEDIEEIVIPNTFNGKPVTSIGQGAFIGCKHNNTKQRD